MPGYKWAKPADVSTQEEDMIFQDLRVDELPEGPVHRLAYQALIAAGASAMKHAYRQTGLPDERAWIPGDKEGVNLAWTSQGLHRQVGLYISNIEATQPEVVVHFGFWAIARTHHDIWEYKKSHYFEPSPSSRVPGLREARSRAQRGSWDGLRMDRERLKPEELAVLTVSPARFGAGNLSCPPFLLDETWTLVATMLIWTRRR